MKRPPRDLRDEAKAALARRLRRADCATPDALAAELLIILDGIHIGLTDTTTPADPNADWRHTTDPAAPTGDYHAARQALKGNQQ